MSFVYPSFLWALGVLSIPVIIHLFNFRRTTRVFFSNTRFLRQVKEATTARRKLKHYLILAARLLFLFFLVITFCQPIIPATEQRQGKSDIVLYLDNSQSMSAQLADKTRGLDAGIAFIQSIVATFPPDTRYKLITNDFAPFSNTFKTRTEMVDLLAQMRLSPVSRHWREVEDRIMADLSNRGREVFWISDFQKSTLGAMAVPDSATRWHLVPITYPAPANVFVDTAYLENPFAAGGEKNVLHVQLRHDGQGDGAQLNATLSVNGIQSGTSAVDLPAGGSRGATFDLATGLSGLNEAKVSFHDFPVSFDNDFFMALNFTEKIRVVEIKPATGATPVEKVYGNTAIFQYRGFTVDNFDYNELNQADLVVLNGIPQLDASLLAALQQYLGNGGTLLVAPAEQPPLEALRSLLMLPSLTVVPVQESQDLDRPDFSNPFFDNVFEEKSVSLAMPKAVRLLDWGGDRAALLRFRSDAPFLSLLDRRGKAYLLAAPLQSGFTDFHQHGLFVPVMYRLAASSKKESGKPYYTLRESFITIRADSLPAETQLKLVGKEELIPGQRRLGSTVVLDIPKFSVEQGFYKIVAGADTVGLVAFNVNKSESLLAQYTGAEVKEMLGGGDHVSLFTASSAGAFSNEIKERYLGTPLWKYALLLALLFLVAEILLIRFMK